MYVRFYRLSSFILKYLALLTSYLLFHFNLILFNIYFTGPKIVFSMGKLHGRFNRTLSIASNNPISYHEIFESSKYKTKILAKEINTLRPFLTLYPLCAQFTLPNSIFVFKLCLKLIPIKTRQSTSRTVSNILGNRPY